MPGSSPQGGSFIPKRGPARRRVPKSKNQIFLFSIITYSILFASLIAAGGTFFYKNYLVTLQEQEAAALTDATTTFSVADLARVRELDITLLRAADRVEHSASVMAILDALDQATVEPVQISSLTVERDGDESFAVAGEFLTNTFDAAIFQRTILSPKSGGVFSEAIVSETKISQTVVESEDGSEERQNADQVTFAVELVVPISAVLFDADRLPVSSAATAPLLTSDPLTETGI